MDSLINSLKKIAMPAGRIMLSIMFILAGFGKITAYSGTAAYMASQGVPGVLLPLVILVELGGGLMLLVGYKTRLAAFLLGGFSVLSGLMFHLVPSMSMESMQAQMEMTNFFKNLAIGGGMAYVFANGSGGMSIDAQD
ncbi:DoxX family protein [Sulfitobacter sp. SK012]|uniref:DoxX family protein n=1 Tax=Sulfitobacter sp. SK012 TaxID=1389005 RepID=UPI0020C7BA6E|nr:DoxX family protein [Sulfitobacter sp. SK012]